MRRRDRRLHQLAGRGRHPHPPQVLPQNQQQQQTVLTGNSTLRGDPGRGHLLRLLQHQQEDPTASGNHTAVCAELAGQLARTMDRPAGRDLTCASAAANGGHDQQTLDAVARDHYVAPSGFRDSAAGHDSGELALFVPGRRGDSGRGVDAGSVFDDPAGECSAVRAEHRAHPGYDLEWDLRDEEQVRRREASVVGRVRGKCGAAAVGCARAGKLRSGDSTQRVGSVERDGRGSDLVRDHSQGERVGVCAAGVGQCHEGGALLGLSGQCRSGDWDLEQVVLCDPGVSAVPGG